MFYLNPFCLKFKTTVKHFLTHKTNEDILIDILNMLTLYTHPH